MEDSQVQMIRVGDDQGRGGLYNMLVPGGFERAAAILPLIGLDPAAGHLFRLRDVWVETDSGGLVVHVYTRVGGGNRDDYAGVIDVLRGHPGYLRDSDDTYDATYASFWFRLPAEFVDELASHAIEPVDTGKMWRKMLAAMEAG